jgi:putative ABC transport system permease protein
MRELLRRLWYFIRRERYASDLEDEMRLHMEMRADAMQKSGLTGRDAELAARKRFGNVTNMTETSRDNWGFGSLDRLLQDLRFAARRLRQRPGLAVPVILVLALGIGATTAVFSALDAAMLRSLPFTRAHELVALNDVQVPFYLESTDRSRARTLDIHDAAAMTEMFSKVAAFASGGVNLDDAERPQRITVGVVTPSFFETIGARALVGRTFTAEEGKADAPPTVILSHGLWRRQYGGANVLGRTITLNGRAYPVVGIMPEGFSFPSSSDLWIPMSVPTTSATFELFRGFLTSTVLARLQPGVSVEQASARVLAAWERAVAPATGEARDNLNDWVNGVRQAGAALPLRRELLGSNDRAIVVLFGATALLMLIACANVANLLLSDAAARRREIAVRGVLGATRRRIVRQLLAESLVLSLAGGVLGVLIAPAGLKVLRAMLPAALAGVAPAQLDLRVLTFAALVAIATSMLFGLWPALGATRDDAAEAIKSGGGHGATAGGMGRVRRALVAAEVALTVMLLVGAGLMLRSLDRLMSEETGMNPEQVATLETSFPRGVAQHDKARIVDGVLNALGRQQGIVAAGAVNDLPLRGGGGISITVEVPGAPALKPGQYRMARNLTATGGYFDALDIKLLRGRTFAANEPEGVNVAVVSKAMSDAYWPGVDPVGRYFTYRGDTTKWTVIGVVADVRERALQYDPTPQMYRSMNGGIPPNVALVVRGSHPPAALLSRLQEAMRAVAPSQAVYNVRTMEQVVRSSVTPRRTNTILITLFGALALMMSVLGVYAVVAYGVAQRTREFGIRAALGATASNLVALVSREMATVVVLGIVAGLAGAWALGRVIASLLYEVDARDPATLMAVPLLLIVPAIVATLIPALRAVRVSPTQVMRAD